MNKYSTSILAIALLNACSAAELQPDNTDTNTQVPAIAKKAVGHDLASSCRQLLTRQRDCSKLYVPALVEERVRRDLPPGTAAKDSAMGRKAHVAAAQKEYTVDSTDRAIAATCQRVHEGVAPEEHSSVQQQLDDCSAWVSCEQVVECSVPLSVR